MTRSAPLPLAGASVLITRPAGTAAALVARVRALGGHAILLPGLSLRAAADAGAARSALLDALRGDIAIFTSPAAVRFAARLASLRRSSHCRVCAVGHGTARALHRHGIAEVAVPATSQDSEGLLALPLLSRLHGRRVILVGAPGGRGLLARELQARGAQVSHAHVYRRTAARLDRRHLDAVRALRGDGYALLSSAEALGHLHAGLPDDAWRRVVAAAAVVSSERLADAARAAGFTRVHVARSALSADLLACAAQIHADRRNPRGTAWR